MGEEQKRKLGGVSDMYLEQTSREPTFYRKNDEHENPCFYWKNPYDGHEEKVAMLFWPTHPYENTEEVEFLYEHLELRFLPPGLRAPVSHPRPANPGVEALEKARAFIQDEHERRQDGGFAEDNEYVAAPLRAIEAIDAALSQLKGPSNE